jgi:uncharacterized protein
VSRTFDPEDSLAVSVVEAIHAGDLPTLSRLLRENPALAGARIGDDDPEGMSRTLLHVATDWPGHFPNGAATVALLVEAGADANARFRGPHAETPLHWAASSNDVEVLDALLDAGADIVPRSPPPPHAARGREGVRAVGRGAPAGRAWRPDDDPGRGHARADGPPRGPPRGRGPSVARRDQTRLLGACHGGQAQAADYLISRGADMNWIPPWEEKTPLDAAERSGAAELVEWLRAHGAKSASELGAQP